MKILSNFDKAFAELIAERVKTRLSFKVSIALCAQQASGRLT